MAFGIAVAVVALILMVAAVYNVCCDAPPVQIESIDLREGHEPVCPGEQFAVRSVITVTAPTLLYIYLSVMNPSEEYNINGTQIGFMPRPHPNPSTFVQTLPWTVPSLPPGKYSRVVAVRGHDTDQDPEFSGVPFTVAGDCPIP